MVLEVSETNKQNTHSYQVSRPIFDEILLRRSEELGVSVEEEATIDKVNLEESNRGAFVTSLNKGQYFQPANFIIDASGQSALIARSLKIREWDESFHNLAVYGYFSGATKLETPDENNIFIESYQNGWVLSLIHI